MTQTAGLAVEIQDRTRAGAIAAGRSFKKIERGAKGAGRAVGGMEKSMLKLGKAAIGGMGMAMLVRGIKDATKASMEFGKSMAEVSTLISGDITAKMAELTTATERMSTAFGQDANTEAKALYAIISAGAEAGAEATNILMVANKLAVGGVTDVATAADGLTSTLNAYGLSASDAMAVSDDLFAAMKAGKTTVGELAAGISNVAPIAAQAGVALEEVLAATAALTLTGEPTQRSMRGLAQVIASTLKPTSEATEMARELRKEYADFEFSAAALKRLGLADFLDTIREATGGSSEKMAQLFGGVESLKPVLALTGIQAEKFRTIFEKMSGNVGDTVEAFDKMSETEFFKMAKLEQNFAAVERGIGSVALVMTEVPVSNLVSDFERMFSMIDAGIGKWEAFARVAANALSLPGATDMLGAPRHMFGPTAIPEGSQFPLALAGKDDDFLEAWFGKLFVPKRENLSLDSPPTRGAAVGTTGGGGIVGMIPSDAPLEVVVTKLPPVDRPDVPIDLTQARVDTFNPATDPNLASGAFDFGIPVGAVVEAEQRLAQRRADLIGESESMTVRHAHEVKRWQAEIGGGDKVRMKQLTDIHKLEKDKLDKELAKETEATNIADAAADAAVEFAELETKLAAVAQVLTTINPELAGFVGVAKSMIQGDVWSAAAQGIGVVFQMMSGGISVAERAAQAQARYNAALQRATDTANRIIGTGTLGLPIDELVREQQSTLEPLQDMFERFRLRKPDQSFAQSLREWLGILEGLAEFDDRALTTRGTGQIRQDRTDLRQEIAGVSGPSAIGATVNDFRNLQAAIHEVFGPETSFAEAAGLMFGVEDAFNNLGDNIDGFVDRIDEAGQRARRLRFTGEEITARTRAAEQFRLAGSDIFLQKAALEELSDTIASIQAAERLSIAAVAAAASGTGTGTGDTGAETGEVSDAVEIDPDSRLDIDLTDRVDFDPFVVTDYNDIIDLSSAVKIRKDWPDAITFVNKYGPSLVRRLTGWQDVISTTHIDGLSKIRADWPDAITFINKYGPSDARSFTGWNDVISETHITGLSKIEKNWDDAISLSEITVSDFNGIVGFHQHVTKVPVKFDEAFTLGRKVVNNWNGMISTHPHAGRAWIDLSQVVRFYGAGAALYRAMRGVRARVDVELSFNTSSNIREQIEEIVNDAMRDGRAGSVSGWGRTA